MRIVVCLVSVFAAVKAAAPEVVAAEQSPVPERSLGDVQLHLNCYALCREAGGCGEQGTYCKHKRSSPANSTCFGLKRREDGSVCYHGDASCSGNSVKCGDAPVVDAHRACQQLGLVSGSWCHRNLYNGYTNCHGVGTDSQGNPCAIHVNGEHNPHCNSFKAFPCQSAIRLMQDRDAAAAPQL